MWYSVCVTQLRVDVFADQSNPLHKNATQCCEELRTHRQLQDHKNPFGRKREEGPLPFSDDLSGDHEQKKTQTNGTLPKHHPVTICVDTTTVFANSVDHLEPQGRNFRGCNSQGRQELGVKAQLGHSHEHGHIEMELRRLDP